MAKVRVFALAKQLGLRSQALLAALTELGVANVTPATAIDEETAKAAQELLAEQARHAREAAEKAAKEAVEHVAAAPAAPAAAATTPATAKEAPAAGAAARTGSAARTERRPAKPRPAAPTTGRPAPAPAAPTAAAPTEDAEAKERERQEEIDTKEDKETEKFYRRQRRGLDEGQDGLAELERELAALEAQEEQERARRAKAGEVVALPELARRPKGTRPDGAIDVPPVVTVLGHVDHGKTTLLDSLRETDVAAHESGGITQHIGASQIETPGGKSIVFIDTPGHEAFMAMRARGAMVTDIAVLIVAANDGIMPQTIEAIQHVKAAGVPVIVAVNKVDLPDANPDRVKQQLLEHQLVPEEWGGDIIVVPVSALKRQGLDELLDMILLVAEVQELWADPKAEFAGIVIESSLDSSQGTVATVLVRNGTLKVGDAVVCGTAHGRVRRLRDWKGKSVKEMGPGSPVEVIGLTGVPEAGDIITQAKNPKEARRVAEEREQAERIEEFSGHDSVLLRDLFKDATGTGLTSLNLIVKGDVWGSVQALESKLVELDNRLEEPEIDIVSTGVGTVSESDVMLAKASGAIIIAFHVDTDGPVRQTAESEGVEIRSYSVIYEVLEDVEKALLGLLAPEYREVRLGKAEVAKIFRISRIGVIAGCRILEGRMKRGAQMRVTRGTEEVYRGPIESLKHFDQDVSVVESPNDCGISVRSWRGWLEGDQIEAWDTIQVERSLPLRNEEKAGR